MKITVELSEKQIKEIIRFSGERKKGPAIRKFITEELMLKDRREISRKVLQGDIKAELAGFENLRKNRDAWRR